MSEVKIGDVMVGVLRDMVDNPNIKIQSIKELAQFILEDVELGERPSRISAVLYICQKMFEAHLETLEKMNYIVLKTLNERHEKN